MHYRRTCQCGQFVPVNTYFRSTDDPRNSSSRINHALRDDDHSAGIRGHRPRPTRRTKIPPQRLKKAGSEGLINFVLSGPVLKIQDLETGIPNSGLRKYRQEEELDPSPLPHIASRQRFCSTLE